MFLRRHRKIVAGIEYDYWTLCESVRTGAGPRQRVVASLGKLTGDEPRVEAGWDQLEALLEGTPIAWQMTLGSTDAGPVADERWEVAHLAALRVERVRDFGEVWLGMALWHRLGLHRLLAEVIEAGKEKVPWHEIAAVLTERARCCPFSVGVIPRRSASRWPGAPSPFCHARTVAKRVDTP